MKKEFVSIRWSDIPREVWLKIVLVNPSEYRIIAIPNAGMYIAYRAYFPFSTDTRIFDVVFPYNRFEKALKAVPPELRQDLTKSVEFELKKTQRGLIHIQNWKVLD